MGAVGPHHERRAQGLAVRQTHRGRGGVDFERLGPGVEPMHLRGEAQGGVERALEIRRFGDPGELRHGGLVRREMQAAALVAKDFHVVDRIDARGIDGLPYAHALEEGLRAGRERIDAGVPQVARGGGGYGRLGEQCDGQARLREQQGGGLADQTATDDDDIVRLAGGLR